MRTTSLDRVTRRNASPGPSRLAVLVIISIALLGLSMAVPALMGGADGSATPTFDDLVDVRGDVGPMGVPDAYLKLGALLLSSNMAGTITLTADVFNMGNDTASGYTAAFYDGVPGSGGTLIGGPTVPSLVAGGRVTVSTSWSASVGKHTLALRLENADASDPTSNNYIERTVYILPYVVAVAGPDRASDPDASVTFNGSSSHAVGSTIVNYTWAFSDSTTGYGAVVSHSFANSGSTYVSYTATLTVRDATGRTAADTATVYVNAASASKPTADAGTAPSPKATELALFNGSMSQGTIVTYSWDFGDGASGSGISPSHAFANDGTYTVSLAVINNVSAVDVDTLSVFVAKSAPIVEPIADMRTDIGTSVPFLILAYDIDGYISSYKWDFADGGTASTRAASHTWMRDGAHRVTWNVSDDDGAFTRGSFWVNITNVPPVASFTAPTSANEGVNVRVDATGSSDPGNDIVLYEWDWNGDGKYDNSSATPVFNYVYYKPGAFNLTLRVTDGEGSTNSTYKRITINNVVPTASLSFTPASPQMEGVEFTFNATRSTEPGMNITAYEFDWNNDGTFEHIVTTPIFRYTFYSPTAGTGNQFARMRVRDEDNTTGQTYFSYRITNAPPLVNDSVTEGIEDEEVVVFVDAYEPGNNLRLFRWDFDDDGVMDASSNVSFINHTFWRAGQHRVWVNVTDADNTWGAGYVRVNLTDVAPVPRVPDGLAVEGVPTAFTVELLGNEKNITGYDFDLNDDGTYDTHSAKATALLNFTKVSQTGSPLRCRVQAVDTEGTAGYWMFKVDVTNTAPTVSAAGLYVGGEGDPLRIDVRVYEPGMDISKYLWDWDADSVMDEETTVPYASHVYDQPGLKNFRVTVMDIDNSTGTATLKAIIINTIPTAVIKQPKDPAEGETLAMDASGSTEPGGDIIAYMWDFDNNLGNGWDLETDNPITDHAWDSPGSYVVKLRVMDEDGSFGEDMLSIMVTDIPPIARLSVTVNPEDEPSVLDGSDSYDPGGLEAYLWTISSPGLTYTVTTEEPVLLYTFDRRVEYTVGLTVLDGDDDKTAQVSVTVPITDIETLPPTVSWTLPIGAVEGQVVTFSASATDPFPQGTTLRQAIDYQWDFGDGSAAGTGPVVTHSFTARENPYLIKLTVRDEDDDTVELWGNVTVGNLAPVVSPVPPITVKSSGTGETTVTATDITPGALTLHLAEGSPAWASVSGMKLTVNPGKDVEAGTYIIFLRVRDPLGTETETFSSVIVTKEEMTVAVTWSNLLMVMVLVLVIFLVVVILVARRRGPPAAAAVAAPPKREEPTPAPYGETPRMRRDLEPEPYKVEPERVAVEMEHEPTPAPVRQATAEELYGTRATVAPKAPAAPPAAAPSGFEFEEEIEEAPAPRASPPPAPSPPPRQQAPPARQAPPQQRPPAAPPRAASPPQAQAPATQQQVRQPQQQQPQQQQTQQQQTQQQQAQKRYRGAGPPR